MADNNKSNAEFNFLIQVDRSEKPTIYPGDMEMLLYPDFETSGPEAFNLFTLKKLDFGQIQVISRRKIFRSLQDANVLNRCLNLQDGIAFQNLPAAIFEDFFAEKRLLLWKSLSQYRLGEIYVPGLYNKGGARVIEWFSVNEMLHPDDLTICHEV